MDPQTDQSPDSEPSDDGTVADAAPVEDEATGAAPTDDLPAAQDTDWAANEAIGDFTTPDVDLSGLTPTDDGDPDDDEDPDPAAPETVDQDATGQALIEEGRTLASEREDLIAGGADPDDLQVPLHPDDVEPTA